ncbi:MAG: type I DNA topoisomerase [Patescibacteria group bacterium]|nr:type I DNA topoisomerase [Patescibacteria group bacterium]MDD4304784.1 type I DNA topoisomerase [Patescibacteria group bacterium]MDD4695269.1 type I DNA topoisomerase [Patescibacteria group bacterium]
MKKLVIVESPTKAKIIQKFLDKSYMVESSFGHVRDLPKTKLGVDIEKNFEPQYVIPTKAKKNVNRLKELAKKSEIVYFATDEDREGEAISWHLNYILKPKNYQRISFHEITKQAILKSLESPREIDVNLVDAQQTRRILDRLVGYKLSPFLWKKIAKGLSAGRVQSVALRLICEKEEEINKFKTDEYWTIDADFENEKKIIINSKLEKIKNKKIEKLGIQKEQNANDIAKDAKKYTYKITNIEVKDGQKSSPIPFTTSTLQQVANQKLGFSSKQTMMLAQQLYEGIDIESEGTGLITYMRTDSLNLSEQFLNSTKNFITKNFGEKYSRLKRFKTKSKNAQEAHEAIRPTDINNKPENIEKFLNPKQYKLYRLIWERTLASQMQSAIIEKTKIIIEDDKKNYTFTSSGNVIKFDGFLKVYTSKIEENILPEMKTNENLKLIEIKPEQHFTEAPAQYNEASLIKKMEELGIGRPSTYAPTISNIIFRKYIIKEGRKLSPTQLGNLINKTLIDYFSEIIDYQFTANLEEGLDEIAIGKKEWRPFLLEFYNPFIKNLEEKYKTVEKIDTDEKTDEVCEKCGKPMIIKLGRFGKFLACSGFPECRNTKAITSDLGIKCPKCKDGNIIIRKTKRGKIFYGCNKFPECKFATWQKPTGELCPECNEAMIETPKGKIQCSNSKCKSKI